MTETELAILDVLWREGPVPIRDIVEAIYGEHTPARHATVKTLLERLAQKSLVSVDTSRFADRFAAKVDRQTFVGEELQQIADSHFGGSLAPMLLTLANRVRLKQKDRKALLKIIEHLD